MSRRASKSLSALACLGLASCVTVNIYFPAPEVRRAAEQIVDETWGNAASAVTPTPKAWVNTSWLELLEPASAYAKEPDINVSTAAIRALKESMRARSSELKPYLSAGRVGIGNNGLLVVRNLEGLPLRDQATVRRLVDAENRDRMSLYREIAKANDFGSDRVDDIQRIFANTWIQKAEKGWPVQQLDGSWTQK